MEKKLDKQKLWKYTKFTISGVLIALMYILAVQGIRLNKDPNYIPSIMGYTYLNVLSNSMEPEFSANDLVIGKKVSDSSILQVGDVVTFRDRQMLVTHRITEINNEDGLIYTKGDANAAADFEGRKPEDAVSIYSIAIPKIGAIISKFHNFTFLGLVWLIFMYLIISEVIKEVKNNKKLNEQQV